MASSGLAPNATTWRMMRLGLLPFTGRRRHGDTAHTMEPGESADDILARAFGLEPDMRLRAHLLGLPAGMALGLALLTGCAASLLLLAAGAILGFDPVTGIRVSASLSGFFLSLSLVWAARWQLMLIDHRQWVRLGSPGGHRPSSHANPGDRDLLYAVPLAIALTWFYVTV